jgi:hypothetical protein
MLLAGVTGGAKIARAVVNAIARRDVAKCGSALILT